MAADSDCCCEGVEWVAALSLPDGGDPGRAVSASGAMDDRQARGWDWHLEPQRVEGE